MSMSGLAPKPKKSNGKGYMACVTPGNNTVGTGCDVCTCAGNLLT